MSNVSIFNVPLEPILNNASDRKIIVKVLKWVVWAIIIIDTVTPESGVNSLEDYALAAKTACGQPAVSVTYSSNWFSTSCSWVC